MIAAGLTAAGIVVYVAAMLWFFSATPPRPVTDPHVVGTTRGKWYYGVDVDPPMFRRNEAATWYRLPGDLGGVVPCSWCGHRLIGRELYTRKDGAVVCRSCRLTKDSPHQ